VRTNIVADQSGWPGKQPSRAEGSRNPVGRITADDEMCVCSWLAGRIWRSDGADKVCAGHCSTKPARYGPLRFRRGRVGGQGPSSRIMPTTL